jgi:hypothetical protein
MCINCKELDAPVIVSSKASKLWNLKENDKYCWICWDDIHWEYQEIDHTGMCLCDLCEHNRNNKGDN